VASGARRPTGSGRRWPRRCSRGPGLVEPSAPAPRSAGLRRPRHRPPPARTGPTRRGGFGRTRARSRSCSAVRLTDMSESVRAAYARLRDAAVQGALTDLCGRHGLDLLVVFGSVLRVEIDDDGPRDLDVAVRYARGEPTSRILLLLDDLYRPLGSITKDHLEQDRMLRHGVERVLAQVVELAVSVNGHLGATRLRGLRPADGGLGRPGHPVGGRIRRGGDVSVTLHQPPLYQPRARHSSRCGRSAPNVVSAPCPG